MSAWKVATVSKLDGSAVLHKTRSGHYYHASRAAAERALDRISRRTGGELRGFMWPASAGPHLTAEDLASGREIPPYVVTVAL